MTEKLFGRGRRGGVLLIAGAVLGAAVAGPGATLAVKAMGGKLTQTTADKRYIKRGETVAAGQTVETKIDKFNSTSFQPIATTKINVPGQGFLQIVGSLSAKDDTNTTTTNGTKLDYRLKVGSTALTSTPDSFELFLPDLAAPITSEPRENGSVNGVTKTTVKGQQTVTLEAQVQGNTPSATILGRSLSVVFVPKGKLPKTKTTGTGTGTTTTGNHPPVGP